MSIITLTTDFGLSDWFVGTMKGVIASLAPQARMIDLSHNLPAGDIHAAAFLLDASFRFFPKRTIHVVVVDPGVGSARRGLAVQTADFTFVGPDNGVLSLALRQEKIRAIRVLEETRYFLPAVSSTFHGRDLFAPVAGHLCSGVPIQRLGPPAKDLVRLPWPEVVYETGKCKGEVVYLDRFGNGITNLPGALLASPGVGQCVVHSSRRFHCPVQGFYQAVPQGTPLALRGSTGFIEIAINGGSAMQSLGLRIGTRVTLLPA